MHLDVRDDVVGDDFLLARDVLLAEQAGVEARGDGRHQAALGVVPDELGQVAQHRLKEEEEHNPLIVVVELPFGFDVFIVEVGGSHPRLGNGRAPFSQIVILYSKCRLYPTICIYHICIGQRGDTVDGSAEKFSRS